MQSISKVTTNLLPVVVTVMFVWPSSPIGRITTVCRFLAVVLMLNLGVALLLVFKKPREGERNRRVTYVSLAYSSSLLATLLFNR